MGRKKNGESGKRRRAQQDMHASSAVVLTQARGSKHRRSLDRRTGLNEREKKVANERAINRSLDEERRTASLARAGDQAWATRSGTDRSPHEPSPEARRNCGAVPPTNQPGWGKTRSPRHAQHAARPIIVASSRSSTSARSDTPAQAKAYTRCQGWETPR
jgi:hypothetical protein